MIGKDTEANILDEVKKRPLWTPLLMYSSERRTDCQWILSSQSLAWVHSPWKRGQTSALNLYITSDWWVVVLLPVCTTRLVVVVLTAWTTKSFPELLSLCTARLVVVVLTAWTTKSFPKLSVKDTEANILSMNFQFQSLALVHTPWRRGQTSALYKVRSPLTE